MEEKRILRRRPEDHHFWLFFASLNAFARPRAPTFRSPRMVRTFTHNNEKYYCNDDGLPQAAPPCTIQRLHGTTWSAQSASCSNGSPLGKTSQTPSKAPPN